ncbi:FMN-linked oxidoreductase [Trametes coccinea BRFM310]|uniref:FMN-linked oxidoreductase n=1 Tax=Trametes coccinea (strain BRFM310) TaxID=1353009 RepID=A0A1Y2IQ30_TRAC3|nr:FMN-linked oxidoreductase [Trametes coccinea BRFM310]
MPNINRRVPDIEQFLPLNEPSIGSPYPKDIYPQNAKLPYLFQPITLRGVTFKNRIFLSPMCQFCSDDGHATDWHFVHIGVGIDQLRTTITFDVHDNQGFAIRGVGAICMEATAVLPEGRISPQCAGIWTDSQMAPLKRIVDFAHAHGTKIGIQLAHAGRKASTYAPWVYADIAGTRRALTCVAGEDEGGWPDKVCGPSDLPFCDDYPKPKTMTKEQMQRVMDAFLQAVERCKKIGYDFLEVHTAHGYLLHEFLSPLSNARTDQFGGSLENRMRFPLEIARRVRAAWDKPLFLRLSATDWADGPEMDPVTGEWRQWGIRQSTIYAGELKKIGVDLVDCSSGGNWVEQQIPVYPGYQVQFAEALKKAHPDLCIGAVGLITEPEQAESYLRDGKADVVLLGRELVRSPHWPLLAAEKLGVVVKPAFQNEGSFIGMLTPTHARERGRRHRKGIIGKGIKPRL